MAAELEQLRVSLVAELVGREAFEQLKREVNQLKAATSGLDSAQTGLRKTTDAAADAIKKQRQALSQGSMQFNQFAGQIAAGTPFMTAFVQQVGDVAYVAGQAGGALGRFGTFLAGPWGAALLVGISVLGPLIAKLMEAKEAAETAAQAFRKSVNAFIESSATVSDLTKVLTEGGIASANAAAKMGRLEARVKSLKDALALGGAAMTESQAQVQQGLRSQLASAEGQLKAATDEYNNIKGDIGRAISTENVKAIQNRNKALLELTADKPKTGSGIGRAGVNSLKKDIEQAQTLDDLLGDIKNGSAIFGREFVKESDKIGESIAKIGLDSLGDNIASSINTAKSGIEQIYQPLERIKSMSEAMGQAFSEGIKGMITGAMSFKTVMSNVIDSVINKLFEMFVVKQITGFIETGIKSIFPGVKAIGGPVQAGKPYIVGERGPEMFVPSRSGSIVPNGNMSGGINISVDARGASDPAAVRQQVELGIAQAAPYIIAAAQNRTLKTAGRARLPGTIG